MAVCPVCKRDCIGTNICPICGFNQLGKDFLNKEDAEQWKKEVVLPFIQNPESLRIWSKEFFLSTIDSLKS